MPLERVNTLKKNQCYGKLNRVLDPIISDYKYPRSVIKIKKEHFCKGDEHPTQKPVELIEWLIKTYTNKGETVLDNCMGSGTTAVACINTNRNFIGFEITKEYWELGTERVKKRMSEHENKLW